MGGQRVVQRCALETDSRIRAQTRTSPGREKKTTLRDEAAMGDIGAFVTRIGFRGILK